MSTEALKSQPLVGGDELNAVEVEIIDLFVNAVRLLGIPKSVGEIYGLLFVSSEPVPLDALVDRLKMSKGSASQGVKLLRTIGAVKHVYVPGDRRDHYVAETQLKKLASGFIKEELEPHIDSGKERLTRLRELQRDLPAGDVSDFYSDQIDQLGRWHGRARKLLPLVARILD